MWWKRLESKTQVLILLALASALLHISYATFFAPRVLNQDEAALLLNARFIAQTGSDEWGAKLPLVFKSFGDAKLPGFISIIAVLGSVMGFFPALVRAPSLVAGVTLPVLLYFLATRLFRSSRVGLAAMLLGVISPWTYHYASVGFESHVALSLFLGSLILWFDERPTILKDGGATLFAIAAGLTYNSPFLLLPFVAVAVSAWRWPNWKSGVRAIALLLVSFALILSVTWGATSQKTGIAFFQDGTVLSAYPEYRAQYSGLPQKLLGNKWVYFTRIGVTHFSESFSWPFLIEKGGANPWHSIPFTGHFAFIAYPLVALGVGLQLRRGFSISWKHLVPLFLLGASLAPAIITTDAPHATRSLFFFVLILLFAGLALEYSYEVLCSRTNGVKRALGLLICAGLLAGSFAVWWVPARLRWAQEIDSHWYLGLEEALSQAEVKSANKVYIVDPEGVLYTRVAVWENTSQEAFVSSVRRSPPATTGLVRTESFGRYEFIFQPSDAKPPGVLLKQHGNQSWSTIVL